MDPATVIGAVAGLMSGCFALRVALVGNAAFARTGPKRISGKRALHGEADWMNMRDAAR
jgi:type IV secretion system protein VirD4